MDWVNVSSRGMEYIKKYRYIFLIIIAGLFLMALPGEHTSETQSEITEPTEAALPTLEDSLARILSLIEGAGKVEVLLTQAEGEQILYQTDEDISEGESSSKVQRDTVLITDGERKETGLVRQINPPVYLGAVILCQGADKAEIRLSIVEAVRSVTGLSSDKITVLKMK